MSSASYSLGASRPYSMAISSGFRVSCPRSDTCWLWPWEQRPHFLTLTAVVAIVTSQDLYGGVTEMTHLRHLGSYSPGSGKVRNTLICWPGRLVGQMGVMSGIPSMPWTNSGGYCPCHPKVIQCGVPPHHEHPWLDRLVHRSGVHPGHSSIWSGIYHLQCYCFSPKPWWVPQLPRSFLFLSR